MKLESIVRICFVRDFEDFDGTCQKILVFNYLAIVSYYQNLTKQKGFCNKSDLLTSRVEKYVIYVFMPTFQKI